LGRFVRMALDCVHREYPNKIAHVSQGDADVKPPRELTPAFYGCFDWHSAVHGHWLLARGARLYPDATWAADARAALARNLTPERLQAKARYVAGPGRASFERPYGLAWVLQLGAELRQWEAPEAKAWSAALRPLEDEVVRRVSAWLPKLNHPVRSGEHSQTAVALGLMLDWARVSGNGGRDLECVGGSERSAVAHAGRPVGGSSHPVAVLPGTRSGECTSSGLPGRHGVERCEWSKPGSGS